MSKEKKKTPPTCASCPSSVDRGTGDPQKLRCLLRLPGRKSMPIWYDLVSADDVCDFHPEFWRQHMGAK